MTEKAVLRAFTSVLGERASRTLGLCDIAGTFPCYFLITPRNVFVCLVAFSVGKAGRAASEASVFTAEL